MNPNTTSSPKATPKASIQAASWSTNRWAPWNKLAKSGKSATTSVCDTHGPYQTIRSVMMPVFDNFDGFVRVCVVLITSSDAYISNTGQCQFCANIIYKQTDRADCFTPCTYTRGKNIHADINLWAGKNIFNFKFLKSAGGYVALGGATKLVYPITHTNSPVHYHKSPVQAATASICIATMSGIHTKYKI